MGICVHKAQPSQVSANPQKAAPNPPKKCNINTVTSSESSVLRLIFKDLATRCSSSADFLDKATFLAFFRMEVLNI